MPGSHTAVNTFGPHVSVPAAPAPAPVSDAPAVKISVDNNHCALYAICQQEAPAVFDLGADGRLRYDTAPDPAHTPAVRQAARCCPMQAITLTTRETR
ncbi:ferredoxin [Streptomyces sp. NBC_01236]|uniref:ferredoxin n=1 Tax=Streptomyces sp. NBC_01236 TaxID=2903789 RepID=UPI002E1236C4|nr:ferredoxin [Streptomyces sp. NBC_01236]